MTEMLSLWRGVVGKTPRANTNAILERVAYDHDVTVADMLSPRRYRTLAYARFDAMSRLRDILDEDGQPRHSMPKIAGILGLADHTTVLHGLRRWKKISAERAANSAAREAAE